MSPGEAAGRIAAALIASGGPATGVLAALVGREVTFRQAGPGFTREPDADEARVLRLLPDSVLYVREGYLLAGTIQVAKVTLRLATCRVPAAALRAIQAGRPAGTVLGPLGMRRPARSVALVPGDARPIRCAAELWLGALPCGLSTEEVPDSLCAYLAR